MAYLCGLDGPLRGQQFEIHGNEAVLGRHPNCHVEVDIGSVSRRHARITFNGTAYFVEDLYSRNFTCLNGEKLYPRDGPRQLADGDKIRVSDVEFVFHTGDQPPQGGVLFVNDDTESTESTIMSRVGVSSGDGSVVLTASPEVKLNALLEITRSLGRTLVLDDVIPQVFSSLFKIFVQADRAFIALKAEDGTLVPRWKRSWQGDISETIRISRTVVNRVMESQQAILSADAVNDSRFNMSESVVSFQIRSMMCAPLIDSEGDSMGVLQIDTVKHHKRFQQEDLEVLIAVANQASIAIDNARMHERAMRQQAVERDLALAREVQHGFLPEQRPAVAGYEFFDFYEPANQVGGDYFDYFPLTDGRLGIMVADVVGKGVAAAMLMAKLSAEARFCVASVEDAGQAMTMLNDRLCRLQLQRIVTAVLAVLDPADHSIQIANAGHMCPIQRTAPESAGRLAEAEAGFPLGAFENTVYQHATLSLERDAPITIYTDGFSEAADESEAFYGNDRILQKVAATSGSPQTLGQDIVDDVRAFIGAQEQSDDMCLVCFGRQ